MLYIIVFLLDIRMYLAQYLANIKYTMSIQGLIGSLRGVWMMDAWMNK